MKENDARDIAIHAAIDHLAKQIMQANGFTRKQALERFVAFVENDEDAPLTPVMPINLRPARQKRGRAHV